MERRAEAFPVILGLCGYSQAAEWMIVGSSHQLWDFDSEGAGIGFSRDPKCYYSSLCPRWLKALNVTALCSLPICSTASSCCCFSCYQLSKGGQDHSRESLYLDLML
jgi:hypothetical protein